MTRRGFVTSLGAAVTAGAMPEGVSLQAQIHARGDAVPIAADFLGFGLEISAVASKGWLTAENQVHVQLIRTISKEGVLRIGGNTADFARWSPLGDAAALPKGTVINQACLNDLAGFLRATGWKVIWTLNVGTGTEEMAADEAAAVVSTVGDRLLCFELGNEPDLFVQAGHRQPGYGYDQYIVEFNRFKDAVRRRVPGAPLAGPAVIGATDWVRFFARDVPDSRLLTEHYYLSVAADPAATIGNLLRLDDRFVRVIAELHSISGSSGIPYRLGELNSFAGGGKAGVSDTFASALWGLDLMFTLAAAGGRGINWETGVNHLGFVSSYSPIFTDAQQNASARPLYYALLAFRQAAGGQMLKVDYNAGNVNVRLHAFRSASGQLWMAIINKDLFTTAEVKIEIDAAVRSAELWPLEAPHAESTGDVTYAGAEVSSSGTSSGTWTPLRRQNISLRRRPYTATAPAASALLVAFS
jgi:hypothetical protein